MKILFLCAGPPRPDGSSDSVIAYNRIRLLAQRGHRISLACFLYGSHDPLAPALESMVDQMELLPPPRRKGARRVGGVLRTLAGGCPFAAQTSRDMQKLVGRLVERTGCDVLIADSVGMGLYLFQNRYLPAVHRVVARQGALVTPHSDTLSLWGCSVQSLRERFAQQAIYRYELQLYRFVDHVMTLTSQERLQLLRRCPELNVSVVPYAIDVEKLPAVDVGGPATQLLLTGCFSETVDLESARWFIKEVWVPLAANCPQLSLCLCGSDAGKQLRGIAARTERVRLVDSTDVIPEELKTSQIVVFPARRESGFQGRVLRMLGAGMAVVATSVAVEGIPVQTGTHAFLADTAHMIQEAIQLLACDEDLRQTMGRHARAMVAKQFSWQRCVDCLEDVLCSVVV